VGVPHGHRQARVAEDFLESFDSAAPHHKPGCEVMASVVPLMTVV
jgi:hypothetical protein